MLTRGIVTMLCITLLGAPAIGQNLGGPKARGEKQRKSKTAEAQGARERAVPEQQMERLARELSLTKEQQDSIRKILSDHRAQMRDQAQKKMPQENREKRRQLHDELQAARQAKDKAKAREIAAQIQELGGGRDANVGQQLLVEIIAVLTPEQKAKFDKMKEDLLRARPALEAHPELLLKAVNSLDLPAETQQKVQAIVAEWQANANPTQDPKERKASRAKALEVYSKVLADLTPEQQAALAAWRPAPLREGKGKGQAAQKEPSERKAKKGKKSQQPVPAAEAQQ